MRTVSSPRPWCLAARMPRGTPSSTAKSNAASASSKVAGNRSRKLPTTSWPVLIDDPKSPLSSCFR